MTHQIPEQHRLFTRLTQEEVKAEYDSKNAANTPIIEIYPEKKERARWVERFKKFDLPRKRKRGVGDEVSKYHRKYTTEWRKANPEKVREYRKTAFINQVRKLIENGELPQMEAEKSRKVEEMPGLATDPEKV